jgi:hypothetical protein
MLKLNILNGTYVKYGIMTEDHNEEIQILKSKFNEGSYIKLYNKCLYDIGKYVLDGEIKIENNTMNLRLNPEKIIKMTRTDLKIIAKNNKKLFDKKTYGEQNELENYYSTDMYPLSNVEKQTDTKMSSVRNKSYPKTNYDFFKYEDFDTFNWLVYHKYLSSQAKQYNIKIESYEKIESRVQIFNLLILQLKKAFGRLRPYQSSIIENIPIQTYITYAGQTPALPSGHSCQGFLFGAMIYFYAKNYFDILDSDTYNKELDLLISVSKDTGHRRIMAGIHYPSDMIASFYIYQNIISSLKLSSDVKPYTDKLKLSLNKY